METKKPFLEFADDFFETVLFVLEDRFARYGDPERFLNHMASFLMARDQEYKRVSDALWTLLALKLARLAHDPTLSDNWVDLAGYAAIGAYVLGKAADADRVGHRDN